jgi:hypothetical protein
MEKPTSFELHLPTNSTGSSLTTAMAFLPTSRFLGRKESHLLVHGHLHAHLRRRVIMKVFMGKSTIPSGKLW